MAPSATPAKIPPKRILVVDDEAMVAQTIGMVLTLSGHQVEIAGDAETALARYEERPFDLVFTDFSLPGMDGLELARVIRERCPTQPIILITAFVERMAQCGGQISNVNLVLGKPFSIQQVQEALAKVFPAGSS